MKPRTDDDLTQAEALRLFIYDEETGILRNRINRKKSKAGEEAGWSADGYRYVAANRLTYLAHRVIWLMVYGKWPADQLDHWDENKSNNRINNLREANNSKNHFNVGPRKTNTSGHKNVYFHKQSGKWQVKLTIDGKLRSRGLFVTIEEAVTVAKSLRHEHHGQFAHH